MNNLSPVSNKLMLKLMSLVLIIGIFHTGIAQDQKTPTTPPPSFIPPPPPNFTPPTRSPGMVRSLSEQQNAAQNAGVTEAQLTQKPSNL